MSENITVIYSDVISGTYIVAGIYILSFIVSIIVCSLIVYLTYVTPNLHTPTNLLVSNTCLCTLVFSGISTINSVFILNPSIPTEWSCRIRGYLSYVSICLFDYSLVIQAISRLFWTVLYRYRFLLTMKVHVYLVFIQISFSFLFPISSIITTHISVNQFQLCLVPGRYTIHSMYLLNITYCIPVLTVIILYIIIYRYTRNSSLNARRSLHGAKRDRELARNILILLGIFLFSGVPVSIYVILASKIRSLPTAFYLLALATPAFGVILEKIAMVAHNKEIRRIIKQRWIAWRPIWLAPNRVMPVSILNNDETRFGTMSRLPPVMIVPRNRQ